jgi:hypothetical protein
VSFYLVARSRKSRDTREVENNGKRARHDQAQRFSPSLDNSDKLSDNAVRCCPRGKKCLILLVEQTRIERATS